MEMSIKNTRSADFFFFFLSFFCADRIDVITNFAVITNYKEGSLYQAYGTGRLYADPTQACHYLIKAPGVLLLSVHRQSSSPVTDGLLSSVIDITKKNSYTLHFLRIKTILLSITFHMT